MKEYPRRYYAPEHSREPPDKSVCARYDRCEGCPYPAHGFICWGKEVDRCLRTDIREKIQNRERCK